MSTVTIPVGSDYDVRIGRGILAEVADLVPSGAQRVLVVHSGAQPYAHRVAQVLAHNGFEVHHGLVPDAEAAKSLDVAAALWSQLGLAGFTRSDAIVAVGGGTVTDLGGFVAATWLRGVSVVQVPTTVLAMVDAAVGGKTGINTPEGKNLVGSFHPPVGVLCDLDVLQTLPRADFVAGLGEVIKGGFIADPVILDLIEEDPAAATSPDGPHTAELIGRKIAVKARVVADDLREAGLREILNYGHTLGHAIEQFEGYRMRHGEAVAIGMVYAAELAHAAGLMDQALLARHRTILGSVGLPTTYAAATLDQLLVAMGRDKKTRGSTLRFVVLDALAHPTRLAGPDPLLMRVAYDRLSGERPAS